MSVIVRGMEMPKNCSDCPLSYDQMACIVTGTGWWSDTMVLMDFDSAKERLHDCPLIDIPAPHGRLIDADKLKSRLVLDNDSNELQRISADILKWIDIQETVIEGSET